MYKRQVPKGTKMYKNKIQGLRGRATGLVFPNFERDKHVINWDKAKSMHFIAFSVGVDTDVYKRQCLYHGHPD